MAKKPAETGPLHALPADLGKALKADKEAAAAWAGITPLARNEWICWVTIVKLDETRKEHIELAVSQLKAGKRRPCCWPGCPHRRPSAAKYFEKRPAAKRKRATARA
jgi:hypothetical protein